MKYTYQEVSESGSFTFPWGDEVFHAYHRDFLDYALGQWEKVHGNVGTDETAASLLVWKGWYDDVTDLYPDYRAYRGPRGGFRMERV